MNYTTDTTKYMLQPSKMKKGESSGQELTGKRGGVRDYLHTLKLSILGRQLISDPRDAEPERGVDDEPELWQREILHPHYMLRAASRQRMGYEAERFRRYYDSPNEITTRLPFVVESADTSTRFSFNEARENEDNFLVVPRNSVDTVANIEENSVWRRAFHEFVNGLKTSGNKFMTWLRGSQGPTDLESILTDDILFQPDLYDAIWDHPRGPDFYAVSLRDQQVLRARYLQRRVAAGPGPNVDLCAPGGSLKNSEPANFAGPESKNAVKIGSIKRSTEEAALMREFEGLGAFYANEAVDVFCTEADTPQEVKKIVARRSTLRKSLFSRSSFRFKKGSKSERKKQNVYPAAEVPSTASISPSSSFDWGSIGSESIWEPENIPKFYEEKRSENHQSKDLETSESYSLSLRNLGRKYTSTTQSSSDRRLNGFGQSSLDIWEEEEENELFLKPLSLVKNSRNYLQSFNMNETRNSSRAEHVSQKTSSIQESAFVSRSETESHSDVPSKVSNREILKELKLVRKLLRKDRSKSERGTASRCFTDENGQKVLKAGQSLIPISSCVSPSKQRSKSGAKKRASIRLLKQPIIVQSSCSKNLAKSCNAVVQDEEISLEKWNFALESSLGSPWMLRSSRIQRFFSSLLGKQADCQSLWTALSLDKSARCLALRYQFLKGDDLYLFSDAFQVLRATNKFSDITLELANPLLSESSSECLQNYSSGHERFENPNLYLKPIKSAQVFQANIFSREKGKQSAPFTAKYFNQPLSDDERRRMDKSLWASVLLCRQKIVELKFSPEFENYSNTLDAFRDCFKFSRKQYASVAKKQVSGFISHLVESRNEILSVFETLVDYGYEYSILINFLGSTPSSEEALHVAQRKCTSLLRLLDILESRLHEVHTSVSRMDRNFAKFVVPMVSLAQTAVLSRIESCEAYHDFCLMSSGVSIDVTEWHNHTQYHRLVDESEFLMDRMELFQASTLGDILKSLLYSLKVVDGVNKNLKRNLGIIETGITVNEPDKNPSETPEVCDFSASEEVADPAEETRSSSSGRSPQPDMTLDPYPDALLFQRFGSYRSIS